MWLRSKELRTTLAGLPGLDESNVWTDAVTCKICGAQSPFFDIVDFNKHCSQVDCYLFGPAGVDVIYHRCSKCGLTFTNFFDDWSKEDFSEFIYNSDYVRVDPEYVAERPSAVADVMRRVLEGCEQARILDYGSGTGIFGERMKAAGFREMESYDPFSNPQRPDSRFDIVTCFEVIEHSPFPVQTLLDMRGFLSDDGCIIFSQTLQPEDIEQRRGSWWYLGPRNGHISTFTPESLAFLAEKAGMIFHLGTGPYAFSLPSRSDNAARALVNMGLPFFPSLLGAPPAAATLDTAGIPVDQLWHSCEPSHQGEFRWSHATKLTWQIAALPVFPCTLSIRIPVVNQIEPDFAARCHLHVRGQALPMVQKGRDLKAEITLSDPGPIEVVLTSPPPIPAIGRSDRPDMRRLGLGILVVDEALRD